MLTARLNYRLMGMLNDTDASTGKNTDIESDVDIRIMLTSMLLVLCYYWH